MRRFVLTITVSVILIPWTSRAGEVEDALSRVEKYRTTGQYSKAFKELEWVQSTLEQEFAAKLKGFFPDKVNGYTGGEITKSFLSSGLTRVYSKGEKKVNVDLSGSFGKGSGLSSLACGSLVSNMPNVQQFRIGERFASLQKTTGKRNYLSLTVCLDGGAANFSSTDETLEADLKKMAETFKYEAIELYISKSK